MSNSGPSLAASVQGQVSGCASRRGVTSKVSRIVVVQINDNRNNNSPAEEGEFRGKVKEEEKSTQPTINFLFYFYFLSPLESFINY